MTLFVKQPLTLLGFGKYIFLSNIFILLISVVISYIFVDKHLKRSAKYCIIMTYF